MRGAGAKHDREAAGGLACEHRELPLHRADKRALDRVAAAHECIGDQGGRHVASITPALAIGGPPGDNADMATVAIIQARMGSSRLPGKVLEVFGGKTALDHCVERARACRAIDLVVIATTTDTRDDVLVELCRDRGWRSFRGSEDDVLDRYHQAASEVGATHVVRLTSDCPLNDPDVISALIARYLAEDADYASTSYPRPTFPLGISAEVVRASVLAQAWRDDRNPAWREHVTPYVTRSCSAWSDCPAKRTTRSTAGRSTRPRTLA